jgi:hypothetical protein
MPQVGFESTIPVFELAVDRAATVMGSRETGTENVNSIGMQVSVSIKLFIMNLIV